ncbi:MAG: MarR family winged helix-turn-helix transcriptional regulator [Rhodoferax sp.]
MAKLYGELFDRLARERIGLSRAQCRLLGALAMHGEERPMSQIELAHRLGLSAMGVAGLCDRMAAAGWIRRQPCASDRRVNEVHLEPRAEQALDAALTIGDTLHAQGLAGLTPAERAQLLSLLGKARTSLGSLAANAQMPA